MIRRALHDGWTVRAAAGPSPEPIASATVPAQVPGVVHLDLLRAGLIPDPYLDDNEAKLAWIGLVDWTYETAFDVAAEDLAASARHELVFDGIDTVATVSLNGAVLADVANQHRSYRFDVTSALAAGENRLTVAFRSPIKYANAQSVALGVRERPYPLPYEAIRKSACSFGWDWGIATYASGLWRPVRLESWSHARLAELRVHARPDGDGGVVEVTADIARADDVPLTLTATVAGVRQSVQIGAGEDAAHLTLRIDAVERWWPAGHGSQPLYDVEVELGCVDGSDAVDGAAPLDRAVRRVGFRGLRWNTEPDASGTPFQLVVNDRPVFVKGVNWIPDDAFPSRVDRDRYRTRLTQARDANLNLIRVWGGGIYESDDFYDLADELGLLTWQDFLFACAAYAEEEPLRSEVEAEARENVTRLGHHASLALLTGNNENLWGYEDWGWQLRLDGKTWGAEYYYALLPAIVAELAPHVPYAPGSPFSPQTRWDCTRQTGPHPNDEQHGSMHLWEQWNRRDWPTYREHTPRFVAEFGWQGPPTWSTLTRSISDDPLTPESPGMIVHQKAAEGNVKLTSGLVPHYRLPEDIDTWHWAMQLNQANAVSCALEWFRGHAPHTAGAIVWQLNDCWPVTSWAAIDGDGREKPLLFAIAAAFAPRSVAVLPRGSEVGDGDLDAVVSNDTDAPWIGRVLLRRVDFDGTTLADDEVPATVPVWGTATVAVPPALAAAGDPGREVLIAEFRADESQEAGAETPTAGVEPRGVWWFAEPRDSALEPARVTAEVVSAGAAGYDVTVTAATLVRDLTLLVDRIDPAATVDRGLVTLLPGESATFRIAGVASLDTAAVLAPLVARSGNDLVVRA